MHLWIIVKETFQRLWNRRFSSSVSFSVSSTKKILGVKNGEGLVTSEKDRQTNIFHDPDGILKEQKAEPEAAPCSSSTLAGEKQHHHQLFILSEGEPPPMSLTSDRTAAPLFDFQ